MAQRKRGRRSHGTGSLFQRGASWYISWSDAEGQRHMRSARTTDKSVAARALAQEVERVAQHRNGLLDKRAETRAAHARLPILQHVESFEEHLSHSARTGERRREDVVQTVTRLIEGMGAETWDDLTPGRVMSHLQSLREDRVLKRSRKGEPTKIRRGLAASSFNQHLQAIKQFTRWMVRDGRAVEDPLVGLQGLNVKQHGSRERRAFTADELRKLIDAARTGSDFTWGREKNAISGPERALLCTLAVETGLRASELRSLERQSFKLDATPPTVTVKAAYSKRRREDVMPMRKGLAEALKAHLIHKAPATPAFNMPSIFDTARMIRFDLDAAGVPREDEGGRLADFHGLRHTFITNLASGGVHPRVAQKMARHSTITLTMDRYSHVFEGDQLNALEVLPDLNGKAEQRKGKAG